MAYVVCIVSTQGDPTESGTKMRENLQTIYNKTLVYNLNPNITSQNKYNKRWEYKLIGQLKRHRVLRNGGYIPLAFVILRPFMANPIHYTYFVVNGMFVL